MKKYLYNGVPLPGLPEWDEVTHPHAYMYHGSGGSFLAVAETRGDPWVGGEGVDLVSFSDVMIYGVSDGAWTFMNSKDSMMHALKETDIFWVNTDLYHTDGTLYLAASDPIPILAPTIDPLSMWLGWKAGNWVVRQRGKKREPVAYLYNGVRLPVLPEWDKTVYPYAHIEYILSTDSYVFIFSSTPSTYEYGYSMSYGFKRIIVTDATLYRMYNGGKEWEFLSEHNSNMRNLTTSSIQGAEETARVIWCSEDIQNTTDSKIYLVASEPVPVYE